MFMVMGRENKSRWWRFQERATPTDALPTVNTADSVNEISKNKSQMFSLILFISVMTLLCVFITLFVRRHLNGSLVSPHNSAGTLHICIMSHLVNKDNTITIVQSLQICICETKMQNNSESQLYYFISGCFHLLEVPFTVMKASLVHRIIIYTPSCPIRTMLLFISWTWSFKVFLHPFPWKPIKLQKNK